MTVALAMPVAMVVAVPMVAVVPRMAETLRTRGRTIVRCGTGGERATRARAHDERRPVILDAPEHPEPERRPHEELQVLMPLLHLGDFEAAIKLQRKIGGRADRMSVRMARAHASAALLRSARGESGAQRARQAGAGRGGGVGGCAHPMAVADGPAPREALLLLRAPAAPREAADA